MKEMKGGKKIMEEEIKKVLENKEENKESKKEEKKSKFDPEVVAKKVGEMEKELIKRDEKIKEMNKRMAEMELAGKGFAGQEKEEKKDERSDEQYAKDFFEGKEGNVL